MLALAEQPASPLPVRVFAHGPHPEITPRPLVPADGDPSRLHDPLTEELRRLVQKDHVDAASGRQVGERRRQARLELAPVDARHLARQDRDIQVAPGPLPAAGAAPEQDQDRDRQVAGGLTYPCHELVHHRRC